MMMADDNDDEDDDEDEDDDDDYDDDDHDVEHAHDAYADCYGDATAVTDDDIFIVIIYLHNALAMSALPIIETQKSQNCRIAHPPTGNASLAQTVVRQVTSTLLMKLMLQQ